MHRIAIALITLPPSIIAVLLGFGWMLGPKNTEIDIYVFVSLTMFYALLVYASLIAVALPIFVVLLWLGRVTMWSSAVTGVITSLLIPGIPVWSQLWDTKYHLHHRLSQFIDLWPFASLGAVYGFAFWFFALRRNPLVEYWNTRRNTKAAS